MLPDVMEALATRIYTVLQPEITDIQVYGRMLLQVSPPAIDIYPGDPFYEPNAFGDEFHYFLSVRARVSTADHEGQQELLLSLMDHQAATSLTLAIQSDPTLGGTIDSLSVVEGPSGYVLFNDPGSVDNRLLGAVWRVQVFP